jgi:hypothetical protein
LAPIEGALPPRASNEILDPPSGFGGASLTVPCLLLEVLRGQAAAMGWLRSELPARLAGA